MGMACLLDVAPNRRMFPNTPTRRFRQGSVGNISKTSGNQKLVPMSHGPMSRSILRQRAPSRCILQLDRYSYSKKDSMEEERVRSQETRVSVDARTIALKLSNGHKPYDLGYEHTMSIRNKVDELESMDLKSSYPAFVEVGSPGLPRGPEYVRSQRLGNRINEESDNAMRFDLVSLNTVALAPAKKKDETKGWQHEQILGTYRIPVQSFDWHFSKDKRDISSKKGKQIHIDANSARQYLLGKDVSTR